MPEKEGDYKKFLTEVVQKQMLVFGPNIALDKARKVAGVKFADDGSVLELTGDGLMVYRTLAHEYNSLSAETFKMSLQPLLAKYPEIKAA